MTVQAGPSAGALSLLLIAGWLAAPPMAARGQGAQIDLSAPSVMQRHYEAAFRLQQAGDASQADAEYKLFLGMALHRMANGHANLGDYARAATLYEEAFEGAVAEFTKAIEMDHSLKGAHYSLGATYLMQLSEQGYDKAEAEFRKEIAIDPNNSLVYTPLGRIALSRHKYAEAEADLNRAVELNRQSADAYLYLGKLYRETGRIPQAEAAFRKSIALTLDPSKDEYAVEQAHFWLGRLLIQSGNSAEGRKEMDISQNLLYLKEQRVQSRLAGKSTLQAPLEKTHEADPGDLVKQKAFEKQVGPPIASSYDNLGVNAANASDFANASRYFEQAAQWNPSLSDADRNWGRAAFAAKEYEKAVGPLSRTLALHPENPDVRSMLGLSLCMTHDYAQALRVLQPIEASLGANPLLATAYAGSMAIAGDSAQGLARLKAIEEANPDKAFVHFMLGEAYASQKQPAQAADELHVALKLDPSSADTKNALALTELALGQKAEALQLFSELAESGSKDGEVYHRLAQLQIELGFDKAAVDSLGTAVRLDPMNAAYHQELADAYRTFPIRPCGGATRTRWSLGTSCQPTSPPMKSGLARASRRRGLRRWTGSRRRSLSRSRVMRLAGWPADAAKGNLVGNPSLLRQTATCRSGYHDLS
jgi:tetratricopeptide (TPR) repeat protein